jgi:hypothetical protein
MNQADKPRFQNLFFGLTQVEDPLNVGSCIGNPEGYTLESMKEEVKS